MSIFEDQVGRIPPQSILHQRYVIIGPLGRGGMSAVYQAVDIRFGNRRVAIKEMSQSRLSGSELAEVTLRFQQEASLLHSLQHPNLPQIYDIFEEQNRSFLVMEYIEGKNLLQVLQENNMRPLPVAQVMHYAYQLCDVLAYLHWQQPPIIFRDLKPTNVMVTENGHIYLIDFGIARYFKEGQRQDTVLLGSPGYAPPEQHGSGQTGPRSDLYALGATLHCCLTGIDPYLSKERFVFAPVRQVNPLVPLELDQLIQRLVAVDERYRPSSALEVQQWLRHIQQSIGSHTVQVAPISPARSAYAPTQSVSPNSISPAPLHHAYSAPQQQPAAVVRPSTPPPHFPQSTAQGQTPAPSTSSKRTAWSARFSTLFFSMLILTGGISLYALNFINNSDHAAEFGLTAVLLLVAIIATLFAHKLIPLLILIIVALSSLASGVAFLMQAAPGTPLAASLVQSITPNNLFTTGLGVATLVLLLWLSRPISWRNRLLLAVLAISAALCLSIQYSLSDVNSKGSHAGDIKHSLLLMAIILLIQSTLLAVQAERTSSHP